MGTECTSHLVPIRFEDNVARLCIEGYLSEPEVQTGERREREKEREREREEDREKHKSHLSSS
jgi:hypothetical protein